MIKWSPNLTQISKPCEHENLFKSENAAFVWKIHFTDIGVSNGPNSYTIYREQDIYKPGHVVQQNLDSEPKTAHMELMIPMLLPTTELLHLPC